MQLKDRQFILPGQLLGEDVICSANCFREGNKFYSSIHGLVRVDGKKVNIIPSSGCYVPKPNDVVIGVITIVLTGRWGVDIGTPNQCTMFGEAVTRNPLDEDLSRYYDAGEILSAKIYSVNEVHECLIDRPFKLEGGLVININPKRIPRVIGRKRSMLNMVKEKTGTKIVVGQNGLVWIKGDDALYVSSIIKKIEAEAQMPGLTSKISRLLDER